MVKGRKKRSLDRTAKHQRDTNLLFIGIEGGDEQTSKEAKYFDIFHGDDVRFQFKIISNKDGRSSPDQVLEHFKEEIDNEVTQDDDEFWLVVDLDRFEQHLPDVAASCIDADITLAVSNPCFEYWLLLHYQSPAEEFGECKNVKPVYNQHAEDDPNKSGGYSAMFKPRYRDAIERARERDNPDERWPNQNGSRVYQLVERFV